MGTVFVPIPRICRSINIDCDLIFTRNSLSDQIIDGQANKDTEDENQGLELARMCTRELKINLFMMHSEQCKIENHLIFLMSDNCDHRKLTSRFFNNNPSTRLSNSNFSQRSFPSFSSYKIRNRASPPSSICFNSPT